VLRRSPSAPIVFDRGAMIRPAEIP